MANWFRRRPFGSKQLAERVCSEVSEEILFGENGVAEGLSAGKIVVDMSSISPMATKEFAKRIEAKGADYLDAPVPGGEVGAKAAMLTIMVGGRRRRSTR